MAAMPCETVSPKEETTIPAKITAKTSHRKPDTDRLGDEQDRYWEVKTVIVLIIGSYTMVIHWYRYTLPIHD
jgi:hypothetical protein